MTVDLIIRNWALVAASVLGFAILFFVLSRLFQESPRGRLASEVAELKKLQREAAAVEKRRSAAECRLAALKARAATTKPRLVSEAEEAVQDAHMMQNIIADQILKAKKRVGDVILEEFTPNRQDVLRARYL